jgi:hypothetical protein
VPSVPTFNSASPTTRATLQRVAVSYNHSNANSFMALSGTSRVTTAPETQTLEPRTRALDTFLRKNKQRVHEEDLDEPAPEHLRWVCMQAKSNHPFGPRVEMPAAAIGPVYHFRPYRDSDPCFESTRVTPLKGFPSNSGPGADCLANLLRGWWRTNFVQHSNVRHQSESRYMQR